MDKRLFRNQLQSIKVQMDEIAAARQISRDKRKDRDDLPKVTIASYTHTLAP
jgi:50S ribosomal subunit-associated GTPase HflX